MDMVRCPECGGWDVTEYADDAFMCLDCGVTFRHRQAGARTEPGMPA